MGEDYASLRTGLGLRTRLEDRYLASSSLASAKASDRGSRLRKTSRVRVSRWQYGGVGVRVEDSALVWIGNFASMRIELGSGIMRTVGLSGQFCLSQLDQSR